MLSQFRLAEWIVPPAIHPGASSPDTVWTQLHAEPDDVMTTLQSMIHH